MCDSRDQEKRAKQALLGAVLLWTSFAISSASVSQSFRKDAEPLACGIVHCAENDV